MLMMLVSMALSGFNAIIMVFGATRLAPPQLSANFISQKSSSILLATSASSTSVLPTLLPRLMLSVD